jgi:hypothetical protein
MLGDDTAELVECDLASEDWELAADIFGKRPVYGPVHAPGLAHRRGDCWGSILKPSLSRWDSAPSLPSAWHAGWYDMRRVPVAW